MARRRKDDGNSSSATARLRAINSKMSVIAQRMRVIEKNEKSLAQTVIHNRKKVKKIRKDLDKLMEEGVSGGGVKELTGEEASSLKKEIKELRGDIDSFKGSADKNDKNLKELEDKIDEMQYVVDTLNPLEYLNSEEIVELVEEKIEERMKESKE